MTHASGSWGTAYELFTQHGLGGVGVDRIVAEVGVAKTTLYRHFGSKDALAVAVLLRHEELWTQGWLESEVVARATPPGGSILAIFDALDEWFGQADYEGCLFINTLLETRDQSSPVRRQPSPQSRTCTTSCGGYLRTWGFAIPTLWRIKSRS